jgi:hypothetical protein
MKAELDEMDKQIKEQEKTAEEMNRKVQESENKVAQEKAEKKISEDIYKEKMSKIEEAKKKANDLLDILNRKRLAWHTMNDELKKAEAEAPQQE